MQNSPGRILLLAVESNWSAEFKNLSKRLGFRLKRVEKPVDALGHIHGFDPHILVCHEYANDPLSLVDLCDALRIPRELQPLIVIATTGVPLPAGDDLGESGIDDIFDAETPVYQLSPSLIQHYRLALTERRLRNREQEILDSLPDALMVLGTDFTLWRVNRAMAGLFGLGDATETRKRLGKSLRDALRNDTNADAGSDALADAVEIARRGGESEFRCRVWLAAGERTLAGQITELAGADGQILVALRDVTDHEQRLLREARRERLATLGNLAVGVAHEIQNPNTFSRINAANLKSLFQSVQPLLDELARRDGSSSGAGMSPYEIGARIEAAIAGVETASARIASVLSTLKSFGQLRGDEMLAIDLRGAVSEAELLTRHALRGKASLRVELPETLPPVRASASQLAQVFINLIENAAQAFDSKEPQARGDSPAEIRIHLEAENDDEITIAVSDNGPGIDEEFHERIFRPYFSTRAQGMGTGLGLSISSDIVRRFGGDLTVRSRRGQGASFLISLKLAVVAADEPIREGTPHV